jgi:putative transposase
MKTLKQRFSVWYNRNHRRYGTLWADRFKSVLVEGSGNPLQTMAAYIDLNPVRAGIVEDPKEYRFSGYAEAVAEDGAAALSCALLYRRLAARAGTKASSEGEQNKRSRLGRRGCNSKFTATGVWVIELDA